MALRILLVDADAERAAALEATLAAAGFAETSRAQGGADLAAAVARLRPDLVIVDMALPDRDALEGLREVAADRPTVLFAGSDDPGFAEQAIAAGVCSYNLSGVALTDVKPILASAIALFRRHRKVLTELAEARALLTQRRLVERAKAILMQNRRMSEPEAYRWLQRKAMNENRKLAHVVAEFVAAHDRPGISGGGGEGGHA
jgi:response regulator NasT